MRLLLSIACALLAAGSLAGEPDVRLHLECIYPTVLIQSPANSGSGVIIDSRYCEETKRWRNTVLSSAHVFTPTKEVYVKEARQSVKLPKHKYQVLVGYWPDWSQLERYWHYDCELGRIDYEQDICTLRFWSDCKLLTAKVARDCKLYTGNDVLKIGCGLGEEMRLDYGKVTAMGARQRGQIRMSATCVPGDSGGPVFHEYELVGITKSVQYMTTNEGVGIPVPNISFAVPISLFTDEDLCLADEAK